MTKILDRMIRDTSSRDSNMEFARIISMFAIVSLHFMSHGYFQNYVPDYFEGVAHDWLMGSVIFCMFGTDLFVLISGYYGIRLSWQKIISLWGLCTFYNLMSLFVSHEFSISAFFHCFIISSTSHWFFKAYFWLLLSSPLLNKAVDAMDTGFLRLSVIVGFVLCCISGWYFGNENNNGYSALWFFYLYLTGRLLNRDKHFINSRKLSFCIYFLPCLICLLYYIFVPRVIYLCLVSHNSPFVFLSAVGAFCVFKSFSFHNSVINSVAKTMPAVIFIHDVVFCGILYPMVYETFHIPFLKALFTIFSLYIGIFLFSFCVEKMRVLFFSKFEKKSSIFIDSIWKKIIRGIVCQQR